MRIEKPLTQEELKTGDLVPKGDYDFIVIDAQEKISKAGSEMIALQLKIWMNDGRERTVFDYLLEKMAYKIGHFAEAVGLYEKYQRDSVISAEDCLDKCGRLKLGIQIDKNGIYADKNAVLDYIPTDEAAAKKLEAKVASAKATTSEPDFFNDDVPF